MTCPTSATVPPYRPAPYLVTCPGSFLTREQLILYFEDFYASLEYANTAPQLVFERLIGNLSVPVRAAIDEARCAGARTALGEDISPGGVPAPADISPVREQEDVRPSTKHVIRSFHTKDGRWDNSSPTSCTKAFFTTGIPTTSRIALALTAFDILKNQDIIASARMTTPHTAGFSVTLSSLCNGYSSKLDSASCSWLELNASDLDLQSGERSLREPHARRILTTCDITFPLAYDQPPQVLVWLKYLALDRCYERSLRLVVSNITTVGFTLHVNSLVKNTLYAAGITWLACSTGRPDVRFGTFHAEDGAQEGMMREGSVAFQTGLFKSTPRVIVGITGFHTDKDSDLCIAVEAVEVTSEGMKWRVDGMGRTNIESVEGSFIVLA